MKVDLHMFLQLPILLAVVSLVYSATRHDRWGMIFAEALRWGFRMAIFLLSVGAAMLALGWLYRN